MSVDATRWAWTVRGIKSTDKLVLLSLADRANEEHEAWPSIDRLSADCCMKRATVISAIERLSEKGVLERRKRFGGSAVYTLVGVESRHDKNGISAETGTSDQTGTVSSAENGTAVVPKTAPEPKTKPNNQPNEGTKVSTKDLLAEFPDLPENVAAEFIRYRRGKGSVMTPTAWKRMANQIRQSGWTAEDALAETMLRGWRGFKAEWVEPKGERRPRIHV